MYPALEQELKTFERRTPKSAESHKRNLKTHSSGSCQQLPRLRSLSHFCERGAGLPHFRDLDGNDYLDHNLCFGALIAPGTVTRR